ncbi:hypothetical protein DRO91_05585 [Candidatus Heimdallarchaeota archaeon]|nr:MAG: hypothetical protein DRO91_05585 [Candidatus Heimdallarchaeota archaeon]
MEDKNLVVKCKLCEAFQITKQDMNKNLADKGLGYLMAKKLALKLGGEKGLAKVKDVGLVKKDERLLAEYIKGTLLSHLSLKHMKYVLRRYPKFKGGLKSWEATKKAFHFNWEALKEYEILE